VIDAVKHEAGGGRQFVLEILAELEKVDPALLRGSGRLPKKHELRYAPAQFRSVLAIAKRLRDTDWNGLTGEVVRGVEEALVDLLAVTDFITSLPERPGREDAEDLANDLRQRLQEIQRYFNKNVEPEIERLAPEPDLSAPESQGLSANEIAEVSRVRKELETSRAELAELKNRNAEILAELEARDELVEARRTEIGSLGAEDLSVAYAKQATHHEQQWKLWGGALLVASLAALIGGYAVLKANQLPDGASTAQIVSHVAVDLLVIGLLIYTVRLTSLQFSVHRHLAAVANNKAAALNTFASIVTSGSSPETRDRLAEVLAQYVFVSDNTGFLDAASDQVTLPERIAGPITQRLNGSS
jgi:hypothetical protein